jgi:hypothetical protein
MPDPAAPAIGSRKFRACSTSSGKTTPADQPILCETMRWLIPLAQSPTTDELAAYFEVAKQVVETLSEEDRLEIHKAAVRMAGGHLRSQLRHVSTQKGVSLDDNSLVLSTRNSNALDLATLIQGLVPLLEAYEHAVQAGDGRERGANWPRPLSRVFLRTRSCF